MFGRSGPALVISATLLTLGGCASYEKADEPAAIEDGAPAPRKGSAKTEQPEGKTDDTTGGTADPYRERAGARQEAAADDDEGQGTIAFSEPKRWPKVLKPAKRPALPAQAKLSVVLVRSGDLAFDAKVVLALEGLLERDPALKSITALPAPRAREATLKSLARQAHKAGRKLLLVDLRPGRKGEAREGLLLWTPTGALLGAYPIEKGRRPDPAPSDASGLGVCDRIRAAYARLAR